VPSPEPQDGEVLTTLQATRQTLPVSVLDLIATRAGQPAGIAIAQTVELARHVEQLGYKRYWVAEHHSIQGLACSATPVLIGHIAAATKTIRVDSGGVMLPNHAPLVVAEQFGTLEASRILACSRLVTKMLAGLMSR
jgi:luciferase family oxidoreductase group 1